MIKGFVLLDLSKLYNVLLTKTPGVKTRSCEWSLGLLALACCPHASLSCWLGAGRLQHLVSSVPCTLLSVLCAAAVFHAIAVAAHSHRLFECVASSQHCFSVDLCNWHPASLLLCVADMPGVPLRPSHIAAFCVITTPRSKALCCTSTFQHRMRGG